MCAHLCVDSFKFDLQKWGYEFYICLLVEKKVFLARLGNIFDTMKALVLPTTLSVVSASLREDLFKRI